MIPTITLILMVLAFCLFVIAGGWPAPPEPMRGRLIAAGLAAWVLAELVGRAGH